MDTKNESGDKRTDRQVRLVVKYQKQLATTNSGSVGDDHSEEEDEIHFMESHEESRDGLQRVTELQIQQGKSLLCTARIDRGCLVTLIIKDIICNVEMQSPGYE